MVDRLFVVYLGHGRTHLDVLGCPVVQSEMERSSSDEPQKH